MKSDKSIKGALKCKYDNTQFCVPVALQNDVISDLERRCSEIAESEKK